MSKPSLSTYMPSLNRGFWNGCCFRFLKYCQFVVIFETFSYKNNFLINQSSLISEFVKKRLTGRKSTNVIQWNISVVLLSFVMQSDDIPKPRYHFRVLRSDVQFDKMSKKIFHQFSPLTFFKITILQQHQHLLTVN